ncbi:MAG: hypothetical protein Fues2KO_03160 [Fuerstiella sp.]
MSSPFRNGLHEAVPICRSGRSGKPPDVSLTIHTVGIIDKVAPDLLVTAVVATLAARVATYVSFEELRGPFAPMASA